MRWGRTLTIIVVCGAMSGCSALRHLLHSDGDDSRTTTDARFETHAQPPRAGLPAAVEEQPAESAARTADLWQRLRAGMKLPQVRREEVLDEIAWFQRNQDFLERTFTRARPYLFHILEEVEKRGMPTDLALLPVVESAFQPTAYSPGKAAGLWQFIPATGKRYGLRQSRWYDGRRDVEASTEAALDYLSALHDQFGGDWLQAIAAYNCGEALVQRRIEENQRAGLPTDFWSLRLPQETVGYVPRMIAIAMIVADPASYRIGLDSIPNEPYWTSVTLQRQVDLARAALALGITTDEMKALNPGYLRGVTDPAGPHRLLLPITRSARIAALEDLPVPAATRAVADADDDTPVRRAARATHNVRNGESLGLIAARYDVSVAELRRANGLAGTRIKAGQKLVIPGRPPVQVASVERRDNPRAGGAQAALKHKVRSGDTLWDIARKYKVDMDELVALNGLARSAQLSLDQELVVRRGESPARALKTAASVSAKAPASVAYEIKRGDSLWTIARAFNVRVADILEWNGLSRKSRLQPGQQLVIRNVDGVRI